MFNVSTDDDEKKPRCPFEQFDGKIDASVVLYKAYVR